MTQTKNKIKYRQYQKTLFKRILNLFIKVLYRIFLMKNFKIMCKN